MDNSSKERRKHLRIYRNFILTYHEKGKPVHKLDVSQVNNVSQGGLNFSSTLPLKEGAQVMVDLKTPFIADPLHLEGIVLECKEKVPEMLYEVRLQFQGVSQEILTVLEKIESYAKSQES